MVNMPLRRKGGKRRKCWPVGSATVCETVFKLRLDYGKAHLMADAQSKKAKLLAQREKLDAEIKALEAKERAQKRKNDTRRKIILGGLAMKAATSEPNIMGWLKTLASGESVSQKDRDLLGLWFEEHMLEVTPQEIEEAPEHDRSRPRGWADIQRDHDDLGGQEG